MKQVIYFFLIAFVSSCTYLSLEDLQVNCDEFPMKISTTVVDTDCGTDAGAITILVNGGEAPYTYFLNDVEQSSPEFTGLASGNYKIRVVAANGCETQAEADVFNKNGVQATVSSDVAGCGSTNGSITVIAQNGQMPYSYALDAGNFQPSNVFTNLAHGDYQVVVKDNLGCLFTVTEKVLSGISYKQSVEPIIMNNCAVSGCHNGTQFPDFRDFANVQANKNRIKEFTQSGFMPQDGSLTTAEKEAIACWVDDGGLNN